MDKPKFIDDVCVIRDYAKRNIKLPKTSWRHVVSDRGRIYFQRHYDKIADTIKKPDQVRQSTQSKNVYLYEKKFDDFYITNTVLGRFYVTVVIDIKLKIVKTFYIALRKRQKGKLIWPQK